MTTGPRRIDAGSTPPSSARGRGPVGDRTAAATGTSGWPLLPAGLVGLTASVLLIVEQIDRLSNPHRALACDISPILSCGSVMNSPQAAVFGFPNPVLGVLAFTVLALTGLLAAARTSLPRWYWTTLSVGGLAGVGFVCWLIYQDLYRIGVLCPYCLLVWAATPIASAATIDNTLTGDHPRLRMIASWRWTAVVVFYAIVTTLVLLRFQSYWAAQI